MHPGAAKKIRQVFSSVLPPERAVFSWLPRFPELGFNRQLHTKASPELRLNRQSISDLQTHIGGSHPILYFKSQITKKYSIVLYYFDWGYDHSTEEEKSVSPWDFIKKRDKLNRDELVLEWFFFFSGVIIASVEGDHSPNQVFIASWSTLFIHEILCMKMILAMNCCCS